MPKPLRQQPLQPLRQRLLLLKFFPVIRSNQLYRVHSANHLQLMATIAERDVLRYTPAGVPIVSAVLMHESQQEEAGVERSVAFEVPAFAAGEISGRFASAELGASYRFNGFLARKNRNSKALVFHIIDFSAA